MRSNYIKSIAGILFIMVAGCSSFVTTSSVEQERQPNEFEDLVLETDEFRTGILRNGVFVPAEELVRIEPGISQQEVRSVLGSPVTSPSEEWWFYNVNLPLAGSNNYLVCQYRITFDDDAVVSGEWRRPQCKSRYDELLLAMTPPVPVVQEPHRITLSSDVLFAFRSASLSVEGERELDDVAYVITEEVQIERVDVEGHADRTGSDAYNMDLSERRARVVGNYLESKGVPGAIIFVHGRGFHDPVVTCEGDQVTEELKRCLQPNRRVEITINGFR